MPTPTVLTFLTRLLAVGQELVVRADVEDVDQHLRHWKNETLQFLRMEEQRGCRSYQVTS